jgi:hypothetical protein
MQTEYGGCSIKMIEPGMGIDKNLQPLPYPFLNYRFDNHYRITQNNCFE